MCRISPALSAAFKQCPHIGPVTCGAAGEQYRSARELGEREPVGLGRAQAYGFLYEDRQTLAHERFRNRGEPTLAYLRSLNVRVVSVVPADALAEDDATVADTDRTYLPYLAREDARAVLIRPDFYIYGMIAGSGEYLTLFDDLRQRLGAATAVSARLSTG
jgi:hypothetical protein